ncbi:MAG: gluconate 2-dehydrogenase subunit 3 family protein [Bryobacteraceae bacterium]|jgi:hypothetical protein
MKRRRFLQAIAAAPAAPLAAQQAAPPAPPPGQSRAGQAAPPLQTTAADLAAEPTAPAFFTPDQFAALRRLGSLLQPPINGHPGAPEAGAPEFLDFLLGVSPPDRQLLYRNGLHALNAQAGKQFEKSFADLDDRQADAILRPLLVAIPWPEDLPRDPLRHFLAQAQRDFRAATENSREWAASDAASGRRRGRGFGGGSGLYWLPIDPVAKG